MSAGFVSRWAVLIRHEVAAEDLDPAGSLRRDVVERWASAACDRYLEECAAIGPRRVRGAVPAVAALGRPALVAVSARATEVGPDSFTLSVRVRPIGGDEARPLDLTFTVEPEAGRVTDEVRDGLIAIEHAARHVN